MQRYKKKQYKMQFLKKNAIFFHFFFKIFQSTQKHGSMNGTNFVVKTLIFTAISP